MSTKTRNIIGWALTAVLAFVFISSAFMKLSGSEQAVKGAAGFGVSTDTLRLIGVIEIVSVLLFIIPRTGAGFATFSGIFRRCHCYTFRAQTSNYGTGCFSMSALDYSNHTLSGAKPKVVRQYNFG